MADRDQEERERRIIAAADVLLEERGLAGLTIRAVLDSTGLARRAFYDRFAGKDDLVLAVFARALQMATDLFAREIAAFSDPLVRLERIVTGLVLGRTGSMGRRSAALSREHLRLAEARPAELEQAIRPLLALIERQLADGMAAGVVRQGPVPRMAALVYNLVSTTVHAETMAEEGAPRDPAHRIALARDIWMFCRGAIAA